MCSFPISTSSSPCRRRHRDRPLEQADRLLPAAETAPGGKVHLSPDLSCPRLRLAKSALSRAVLRSRVAVVMTTHDTAMAPTTPGSPPAGAGADSEALVGDHGAEAFAEARTRERDVVLLDLTSRPDANALALRRAQGGQDDGQESRPASTPRRGCSKASPYAMARSPSPGIPSRSSESTASVARAGRYRLDGLIERFGADAGRPLALATILTWSDVR